MHIQEKAVDPDVLLLASSIFLCVRMFHLTTFHSRTRSLKWMGQQLSPSSFNFQVTELLTCPPEPSHCAGKGRQQTSTSASAPTMHQHTVILTPPLRQPNYEGLKTALACVIQQWMPAIGEPVLTIRILRQGRRKLRGLGCKESSPNLCINSSQLNQAVPRPAEFGE